MFLPNSNRQVLREFASFVAYREETILTHGGRNDSTLSIVTNSAPIMIDRTPPTPTLLQGISDFQPPQTYNSLDRSSSRRMNPQPRFNSVQKPKRKEFTRNCETSVSFLLTRMKL
jgi:hypothetical protein